MKPRGLFWILLVLALGLGILITWMDSQPNWDDSGITAAIILFVTAGLGLIMPQRAWLWALLVGGGIPLLGITLHQNYGAILALVIGFIGAYLGAFGRKGLEMVFKEDQFKAKPTR